VAESSSACRAAFLDSNSIICDISISSHSTTVVKLDLRTFFCRRTTLVHFFSKSPSYFLLVAASKLSPIFSSSRNAAALLGRFEEERYAIIDLCLVPVSQSAAWAWAKFVLQLLGLPRRQDLAHGDRGSRYMKLEVTLFTSFFQGDAPGRQLSKVVPPMFILELATRILCAGNPLIVVGAEILTLLIR